MPRARHAALFLFLLLAAAAPAGAQYINTLNGMQFNNMYAANADFMMSQMIRDAGFRSMMASMANVQGRGTAAPAARAQAVPAAPSWRHGLEATDFRPAGQRRVPEELAAAVESAVDRADLIDACHGILDAVEQAPDFRRHNLAYAMTLSLGLSIQLVRGSELDQAEEDALLRTVNDALADTGALDGLSPADRTRAYDTFVITGGLMAGIAQNAAETGDREMQAIALDMARSTLAAFGLNP
jgi:hypothetical protein